MQQSFGTMQQGFGSTKTDSNQNEIKIAVQRRDFRTTLKLFYYNKTLNT
jgi:hypothetical protein